MNKLLLSVLFTAIIFSGCKKESSLTSDGKPKTDAANNILRVDASANSNYTLNIASVLGIDGSPTFTFNKADLNAPYEYMFKATEGEFLYIEVWAKDGTSTNCDIFYKGVKIQVPTSQIDHFNGGPPSHINITYQIGH